MGSISHHAILLTAYSEDGIKEAYDKAVEIFHDVSPIMGPFVNGYVTFFVPPDGSKEGRDSSNLGDERREQFIAWLTSQIDEDGYSPYNWVEVQYGDDYGYTKIVRDSDEKLRELQEQESRLSPAGTDGGSKPPNNNDQTTCGMILWYSILLSCVWGALFWVIQKVWFYLASLW